MTDWDAAIVGSGPAGSVAAMVLARAGRRVVLLDDLASVRAAGARKVGESLPGAARPLLRDLGLEDVVAQAGHLPLHGTLSAWGSSRLDTRDALSCPNGAGWHLDRLRFDADIRATAIDAGAVHHEARVATVESAPQGWRVHSRHPDDGASEHHARWVIDGTGRRAAIARAAGISRARDDRLVALCAWTSQSPTDDTRTLIEAVPDGWWYTAGLPDGGRVVVLHVDAADAKQVLHTPGDWRARLDATVHVRRVVGDAALVAGPRATEACGGCLDAFAWDGGLAVGDAALSFDPLSSQGMLNALYTGLRGAQAVDAALGGDLRAVRAYNQQLHGVRAAYLRHHRVFYAAERRWADAPFWHDRQATA